MKLLLAGYFGCGNLGDEAILEALIGNIKTNIQNANITVISGDPSSTKDCYHVDAIDRFSFLGLIRAIRNCDALILGGGGLLQDITSRKSLLYYLSLVWIAKFFKKKTILLGQGIGPIKSRSLLRAALKHVDLITVRDDGSLKELLDIKVKAKKIALTADISFLLNVPEKSRVKDLMRLEGIQRCRTNLIGVSLRSPVKDENLNEKIKLLASEFDRLIRDKDCQLVFLVFKHPDDLEITRLVMKSMQHHSHIVLRQCKPSDMLAIISELDALIGMRLHSLIFSSMAKVPAFGLSYDPKVENFQKLIGSKWIDIQNIDKNRLSQELDGFLGDLPKNPYESKLLSERSAVNIQLLKGVLNTNKIDVLGVHVDNVSMEEAVKKAEGFLNNKTANLIVTPNPEIIIASQKDIDLKNIINNASLAPADGVGLMVAARLMGRKFKKRIPGIDLMMKIANIAKEKGYGIFLFGGEPGVAEAAAKKLGANVKGVFHGYSKSDQMAIDKIKQAKPDILFIGLGSPRQEKWASKHLKELNIPLVMCVGGSLDVISGRKRRAPFIMRIAGIEWLWRLILEPWRWKRMLQLPVFVIKVFLSRF